MIPDDPDPGETAVEPPADLPPVRRSFPVPVNRPVMLQPEQDEAPAPGLDWKGHATRAVVAVAVVLAGFAAWVRLRPGESPGRSTANSEVVTETGGSGNANPAPPSLIPEGPPDAARDIYLSTAPVEPVTDPVDPAVPTPGTTPVIPVPDPSATDVENEAAFLAMLKQEESINSGDGDPLPKDPATPAGDPGMASTAGTEGEAVPDFLSPDYKIPESVKEETSGPKPLGELEMRYLAALERAAAAAPEADAGAWAAEIQRVKSGTPLPVPTTPAMGSAAPEESLPAELQRLQSIYRKEAGKQSPGSVTAAAETSPDARTIDLYFMGDDHVKLLVNGTPEPTKYLNGSERLGGSVQKARVTLKPGDVLGFQCTSEGGQRNFCLMARAGVQRLFATSEKWEAATVADEAWWKGAGGKPDLRSRILRGRVDYNIVAAARFEKLATAHSADYAVIWAGTSNNTNFRYRIRSVDLPERKTREE